MKNISTDVDKMKYEDIYKRLMQLQSYIHLTLIETMNDKDIMHRTWQQLRDVADTVANDLANTLYDLNKKIVKDNTI